MASGESSEGAQSHARGAVTTDIGNKTKLGVGVVRSGRTLGLIH